MDQLLAYLEKVGNQYKPHRHKTVVACMIAKFGVTVDEAEAAVASWLESRR